QVGRSRNENHIPWIETEEHPQQDRDRASQGLSRPRRPLEQLNPGPKSSKNSLALISAQRIRVRSARLGQSQLSQHLLRKSDVSSRDGRQRWNIWVNWIEPAVHMTPQARAQAGVYARRDVV